MDHSFLRGLTAGILLMVGAQALYWFIGSSSAADASTLRTSAVGLQAIIGFGGALWLYRRQRSRTVKAA